MPTVFNNHMEAILNQRILRLPDVRAKAGLQRSTIYLRSADGSFPKPLKLGPRSIGWLESEVDQWIEARAQERDRELPA